MEFTEEEKRVRHEAAVALRQVVGSRFGTELYNEINKRAVNEYFELVLFRFNWRQFEWEVFVTERGPDEVYPGQIHAPGTARRAGEGIGEGLQRLYRQEGVKAWKIRFAGNVMGRGDDQRGSGTSIICAGFAEDVGEETSRRKWMSLKDVCNHPKTHIGHKIAIIPQAFRVLIMQQRPKVLFMRSDCEVADYFNDQHYSVTKHQITKEA